MEKEQEEEDQEELLPAEDVQEMDIDMGAPLEEISEEGEDEIQVPPPFQLDVTETVENIKR